MMMRVLIFASDSSVCEQRRKALEDRHLWVATTQSREDALEKIEKQFFHLCLWPIEDGSQTNELVSIKSKRPETAIVVTANHAEPQLIVSSMRAGASQYWHNQEGLDSLAEKVEEVLKRLHPTETPNENTSLPEFEKLVGRNPKIKETFHLINQVKDSDCNVLITGESGTGKELVARAIHFSSHRQRLPWVAVNCGAIPPTLLESELFGHVKGAFTGATQNRVGRFQMAGKGTLFLDEIGDLGLDLQAKLLRALQNRTYEPVGSAQSLTSEARIIAATNQDLETAVASKKFREDLFYRLNVIPIYIPPLRARKTDIPLLVNSFLKKLNETNPKKIPGITEDAMRILTQYHWPGNVRELENLIERVVILKTNSDPIEPKDFPVGYFRNVKLDRFVANVALPDEGVCFNEAVNDFENELILQALRKTQGNKNKAASLLSLNRTTLVEKLKRKGLVTK